MILKRLYNEKLAQAAYIIGCGETHEAVVIDANRHLDEVIQAAADEGLRITAVTETHIHADYLSGSRELAQRAGATLYVSDEGDADWKYEFAGEPNVRLVRHGDAIRVGKVRLDVVRTPGHTPEHIAFIVTDEASASEPLGVFTGDFIFVGDVGRPDLLERAAHFEGTMEKGARVLFQSIRSFNQLDPSLLIWPAHGAGSACGKALGGVPVSTLAYERLANWAFQISDEDRFVDEVLQGQPEPPVYFKEMKFRNKRGPALLGELGNPPRLPGERIFAALESGVVVDIRSFGEVGAGYVPGTINIPLDRSFVTWSGWHLPYDRPIYLISNDQESATEAARDLVLIGLDDVRGWLGRDGWRAYEDRHGTLPLIQQAGIAEAHRRSAAGEATLLDVRGLGEYQAGHAPGALHIPLGYLSARLSEVPSGRPVYVQCGGGTRSAIGASILKRAGFDQVANLPGGFYEYKELGLPIETALPQPTGSR